VKTEGYDSDSSDDEEGPRRRADPAGGGPGAADEDDDMFAMGEREAAPDADGAPGGAKKEPEFLRLGDIEGQEFHDEKGSDASSDVSDEPIDDDEAERRKKAGMGFELSSFNMREEMEEGKFTEDGMYMRTYDAHAVHDRWLEGMDERELKQARRKKKEREKAEKERQQAEEKELQDMGGKEQLERNLLSMLKRGETVLEALQRLGVQAKKEKALAKG
jgi:CD2 antigen cytoplasmic tail-binding protein 2